MRYWTVWKFQIPVCPIVDRMYNSLLDYISSLLDLVTSALNAPNQFKTRTYQVNFVEENALVLRSLIVLVTKRLVIDSHAPAFLMKLGQGA